MRRSHLAMLISGWSSLAVVTSGNIVIYIFNLSPMYTDLMTNIVVLIHVIVIAAVDIPIIVTLMKEKSGRVGE